MRREVAVFQLKRQRFHMRARYVEKVDRIRNLNSRGQFAYIQAILKAEIFDFKKIKQVILSCDLRI